MSFKITIHWKENGTCNELVREYHQKSITIGRDIRNDFCISGKFHFISAFHVKIEKMDDQYFLFDLNSTNGTYLNNERLECNKPEVLMENDIIKISDFEIKFNLDEPLSKNAYNDDNTKKSGKNLLANIINGHVLQDSQTNRDANNRNSIDQRTYLLNILVDYFLANIQTYSEFHASFEDFPKTDIPEWILTLMKNKKFEPFLLDDSNSSQLFEAIKKITHSLNIHHQAVIKSFQSCLYGLLNEISPDKIKENCKSVKKNNLVNNKKELWRKYTERHIELVESKADLYRTIEPFLYETYWRSFEQSDVKNLSIINK